MMAIRTTTDHVNNPVVLCAASWFAGHRHEIDRAIVPGLRQRFGLSPAEAVEVLRLAKTMEGANVAAS